MLVLSVLYNSETWTLKGSDEPRRHVFKVSVLRICGISLCDRWRNEEAWLGIECDEVEDVRKRWLS